MMKRKLTLTFLIVLACSLALTGCKEGAEESAELVIEADLPEVEAPKLAEAEETMPWWSPPGLSTEGSEERMARMRERWEDMSEEQRERFRDGMRERKERWENMSEEERQEYLDRMRERRESWRNMSEEERQEFRARRRERRED
jgi:hypothetical protein